MATARMIAERQEYVYVTYYGDWSGFGLFTSEIDALRHAVKHKMEVSKLELPIEDVREYLTRRPTSGV